MRRYHTSWVTDAVVLGYYPGAMTHSLAQSRPGGAVDYWRHKTYGLYIGSLLAKHFGSTLNCY